LPTNAQPESGAPLLHTSLSQVPGLGYGRCAVLDASRAPLACTVKLFGKLARLLVDVRESLSFHRATSQGDAVADRTDSPAGNAQQVLAGSRIPPRSTDGNARTVHPYGTCCSCSLSDTRLAAGGRQ